MIMSLISILSLLFRVIKSPDLFRIMPIVRNIPVSTIRDPLRFSFFVSAPAGALSSFVCALHRFSDKCLVCRMAWPSSRPRDSAPRHFFAGRLPFKRPPCRNHLISAYLKLFPRSGKHFSGTRIPRPCARAFRVCARACYACRPWSKGFPCDDVRGPRDLAAFLPLFAMITPQFAFILHRGPVDRWKVALLFLCSWRYFITINSLFEGPAVLCLKSYTISRYVKCT